jgi:hypothetical protein
VCPFVSKFYRRRRCWVTLVLYCVVLFFIDLNDAFANNRVVKSDIEVRSERFHLKIFGLSAFVCVLRLVSDSGYTATSVVLEF